MNLSRIWIYCRTANNDNNDLSRQYNCLSDYAKKQGLEVVGGTKEISNGLISPRKGLNEVMDAVKENKIDSILIKDIARIGRDMIKVLEYIEEVNRYGVNILTISDDKKGMQILDKEYIFRFKTIKEG